MEKEEETTIRILHLEDDPNDSLLVRHQLKKDHINFEYLLAVNQKDLLRYLETEKIDIILSDYNLPSYNGSEALDLIKSNYPNIPFVFVSGVMGEDIAIESLLSGATDYVLKNRLNRLGPAINRALRESKLRQEYQKTTEALRQREEQYRTLVDGMNEGIMLVDNKNRIQFVNQQTCNITGFSADELIGKNCNAILYDEPNQTLIQEKIKLREQGIKDTYDIEITRKDKKKIWIRISVSPVYDNKGNVSGSIEVIENIHERKIAEVELRKLTRAVDQSPASIMITDTAGIIEYANPSASRITGYPNNELIGKKPGIFKSGDHPVQLYKQLWKTIKSGKIWSGEFHNRKKNGEKYWESVSISPIFNSTGEITHFLSIKEDTTERIKLNLELVSAKEKAEESDRLKSAFLANISHEIRTPMNGILGFSELLKTPNLSWEARNRYVHIIEQNGLRMLSIINDIVDISKIEARQMNVIIQETNVNYLMKDLQIFFSPQVKAKGLQLSYTVGLPDEKSNFLTDHPKLTQILTNLIKNAIKFTHEGSIEFGYNLIRSTDTSKLPTLSPDNFSELPAKPDKLEFYVKDTGVGIPPGQYEMIFESFRQGSVSLSRAYEGAGLGLSISKALVEMLGGKIWLKSEPGAGTSFYFQIPVGIKPENKPDFDENKNQQNTRPGKLNILIAEDDENSRFYVKIILENENVVIFEATNGKEAVESVKNNPDLDLVLMDMKMPVMDGFEAARQIKKLRPELIIIAQTAYAFMEDEQKAIKAGCDDYVSKPLKRQVLEEKIQKFNLK